MANISSIPPTDKPEWESINSDLNRKFLKGKEFWRSQPDLFEGILKILFQHDPILICRHSAGASEYGPEVNTILPRLNKSMSAEEVEQIVYEEFVRWFDDTARRRAGKFKTISMDICTLLHALTTGE